MKTKRKPNFQTYQLKNSLSRSWEVHTFESKWLEANACKPMFSYLMVFPKNLKSKEQQKKRPFFSAIVLQKSNEQWLFANYPITSSRSVIFFIWCFKSCEWKHGQSFKWGTFLNNCQAILLACIKHRNILILNNLPRNYPFFIWYYGCHWRCGLLGVKRGRRKYFL